ncbi:undecaprenyldiphospho-muramoylpentapeptide beta-N-acetylglucosaminyltransferase [Paenibacillus sp. N1-5-1-14]|uniref:undecaprenyldiphospho-muramoylpentapeptide beta-N-acetylglucosaminyltransferase n=1 Tax=Paenibacillus radicibacter TaxID=2972488 RepID=UPI0021596EFD|nr:undecaprenyldiphospho-muramoylpentapeptide beta-N-acetylglucosaminyltransferase [Paenibacillus radicibacter]MCR8641916.1 undecaprenyldiphospho-muramoylpentapeptide beta-N-acetylglucosaminyltransferase [Paenibacillus radicibacter]
MRVVLSGGGTGGHVYPALAIAEQVVKEDAQSEFLYIGTNSGLERDIVANSKLTMPFEAVEISGFRRKLFSLDNVKTIARFFRGVSDAKKMLREFKPDVVIGTGGYVCGPVLYAAAKLGIPSMVHEQNVIPGMTNAFLSRYVSTVAVSFKGTESRFPKARNAVYTGNPRATSVALADRRQGLRSLGLADDDQLVVVVGGSRGAKAINEAMITVASQATKLPQLQFLFITGQPHYEAAVAAIRGADGAAPRNVHVVPYIHNMPEVLAATKLIVSRAGASFLAEITSLGIPAILIPSPYVTNNHQEHNARMLVDGGAAQMILEKDLNADTLLASIQRITGSPFRIEEMANASRKMGQSDSAKLVVSEMHKLVRKL